MLSTPESVGTEREAVGDLVRSGDSRIGLGQALRENLLWGEPQTRQKDDRRSTGGGLHA